MHSISISSGGNNSVFVTGIIYCGYLLQDIYNWKNGFKSAAKDRKETPFDRKQDSMAEQLMAIQARNADILQRLQQAERQGGLTRPVQLGPGVGGEGNAREILPCLIIWGLR